MSLFPGWGTSSYFTSWSANRTELVQHFRGWNYVAIRAICEEVAGMFPQVAYRCSPDQVAHSKSLGHRPNYLPRRLRVKAIANVQTHEELEPVASGHPLLRLFQRPNQLDTWWSFRYKTQMYQECTGNSYVWVVPNRMKQPCELWPLPAQWVYPRAGDGKLVDHYDIRPSSGYVATGSGIGWFPGGGGRMEIPAEQIIHVSYPNPVNFFDGLAPLTATSQWTDSAEAIDGSRIAQFQNGAFPGVVLEIDKEVLNPDPNMIARIMADFSAKYSTVRNTGQPMVLGPGITCKPFNMNPKQMDYVEGADQLKKCLLATHRVGSSAVGLAEENSYASMLASYANFHQSTIKPKHALWGQVLSVHLATRWDPDLIVYWPDSTPADPELELRKHQIYLTAGVLSINDVRADIGMEPYENEIFDEPLLPQGLAPVGSNLGADDFAMPGAGGDKPAIPGQEEPGKEGAEPVDREELASRFLTDGQGVRKQIQKYFDGQGRFQLLPLNGFARKKPVTVLVEQVAPPPAPARDDADLLLRMEALIAKHLPSRESEKPVIVNVNDPAEEKDVGPLSTVIERDDRGLIRLVKRYEGKALASCKFVNRDKGGCVTSVEEKDHLTIQAEQFLEAAK